MEEILNVLDFVKYVYEIFGFEFKLNLSTKPDNALGDDDLWEKAEEQLEKALNKFGAKWELNPKDGAFYGPKIDITVVDALKRPHQCATIQLDFQGPIRFDLSYKTDHTDLKLEEANSDHLSKGKKGFFSFPADEYDPEPFKWEENHLRHGFARPVIIHRAILGSIERFMSIVME